jgi:hypothetical protein
MKGSMINFILFIGLVHVCLSTSSPQWTGTFEIDGSCEQTHCCCLIGQTTISKPNDTELFVIGSVAGEPCREQLNGSTTIAVSLPIPQDRNGFQITVNFLGSNSRFTLSADSQYIANVNLNVPTCSDSAHRINGGNSIGSSVSSTSFFLLINAFLFYIFLM